ncbi:hypothetical protein CQ393_12150 [Stenotrophomonas sp. MYb238]|uniref:hypothetical protein n=1 Tax=Stenotrophomonas sp. MYb238 TaxID=2040281 RepID=UPI0012919FEA|nr:hypothetical protein [Stenotrophomonas sp. MYb238]MQP76642.1 hypothetical protein [Stenotrophomonas sp. MYb238]
MIIDLLVIATPFAIIMSFLYIFELSKFINILKGDCEDLWIELGRPVLGRATREIVIPLLLGRFRYLDSMSLDQRGRALRLRIYLVVLLTFYILWIVAVAFRRQLGWGM